MRPRQHPQSTRPQTPSYTTAAWHLRTVALLGAGLATLLLAGCETAVSLNGPAPVVQVPMSPPVNTPPVPRNTYSPPPTASVQPPAAQAQPLQPTPGIAVQPLAPESAPSAPAASSAYSATYPAASAPPGQPAPGSVYPPASPSSNPPSQSSAAQAPAAPVFTPQSGPLPANAVRYVCNDGTSFVATFGDVSVNLSTALGTVKLEQTVAADGARYKNGDLQVWFKGRQATVNNLTQAGSTTLCVEQR
uniref:C-type lysozyme inhibitor domain-containing protein n=1 Tax=mine drainage metagenome TaxID=410659 RepID=E6PUX2_9ZZZZ